MTPEEEFYAEYIKTLNGGSTPSTLLYLNKETVINMLTKWTEEVEDNYADRIKKF